MSNKLMPRYSLEVTRFQRYRMSWASRQKGQIINVGKGRVGGNEVDL